MLLSPGSGWPDLLQWVEVVQLCPSLCDPLDYILQARILEWVAFPVSRGFSQPRDQTQVSHIAGEFFTSWGTRENLLQGCNKFQDPLPIYLLYFSSKTHSRCGWHRQGRSQGSVQGGQKQNQRPALLLCLWSLNETTSLLFPWQYPSVHCSIFTIARARKWPKCPLTG